MSITTAIILASGFGTRMLPVTAGIQKEMLPILDRPVVDYVVSDLVAAGIKRILFVVHPGEKPMRDYYLGNPALEAHLERFGKHEALENLKRIRSQANFEFMDGNNPKIGYGSAMPIILAAQAGRLPDNEPFMVCDGDGFSWSPDGSSEAARLIAAFEGSDAHGAITALPAPDEDLPKYGVLRIRIEQGREYLDGLVEKPARGAAPSNLINLSKHILTPAILPHILNMKVDPKSHEFYLTHAIDTAAQDHPILVHRASGQFLDAGTLETWLEANQIMAAHRARKS